MKLFTVKKCKQLLKDKYNLTKGLSRHTKQQLNDLLYTCKHNVYLERKKIKHYSTTEMVHLWTKDENITAHIMSYVVDFKYNGHLKLTIHYSILTELQMFHLSRHAIVPRKFYRGKDDTYNKEFMLNVHTYLMNHSTKGTFFISSFAHNRIHIMRQYCEEYLNNNAIINNILDNNRFVV